MKAKVNSLPGCRTARGPRLALVVAVLALGLTLFPSLALNGQTPSTSQTPAPDAQDRTSQPESNPPEQSAEAPDDVLAQIWSVLKVVTVPQVQALADALGVPVNAKGEASFSPLASSLAALEDLDGDGIPEVALKWFLPDLAEQDAEGASGARRSWRLFLLAWDGRRWQASPVGSSAENLRFEVIRLGKPSRRGLSVVVTEGEDAVPYPAVYQVKNHAAELVWDGKADESRYQGYPHARIEFHDVAATNLTEMVATGRADPGLLAFPKESRRGFEVRSTYRWDGQGFVPVGTEYSPTPDLTLYRFIAALHLRDFRSAYALIDAPKFLNTDAPTLDIFRQLVEGSWPEFLNDNVFEAMDVPPDSPDPHAFMLEESDKKFVYHPTFTAGTKSLLAGLERHEEK